MLKCVKRLYDACDKVDALERRINDKCSIYDLVDVLEMTKMTDDELYNKYKYLTWCGLSKVQERYLSQRFKIQVYSRSSLGYPVTPFACYDTECIGLSVDRLREREKERNISNDNL